MDDRLVREIVSGAACALGYRPVDLQVGTNRFIRLLIEREPDVPIHLDDCQRVCRAVHEALRAEGMDPEQFHIEVNSPGLDRPLHGRDDFQRFKGRRAALVLREKRDGRRRILGTIEAVNEGSVQVREAEGKVWTLRLGELKQANLEPDI